MRIISKEKHFPMPDLSKLSGRCFSLDFAEKAGHGHDEVDYENIF